MKGTLAGMLAAELAVGHDSELANRPLEGEQPRRLPPEPLAYLGINAVMRWKEYRAGVEL